jgi:enamine deaminase RidA (YjgF/YER057c/UK114 family)
MGRRAVGSKLKNMTGRRITRYSPFDSDFGYSRAVIRHPFVFVSGTKGFDYPLLEMPDDVSQQTWNIWGTISAVLKEADSDLAEVVKVTVYITENSYVEPVLRICGQVLADIQPALTIVIVQALLREDIKVEIEVTAMWRVSGVGDANI